MKLKRILSLIIAGAIIAGGLVGSSTAVSADDYTADELDCSTYDIRKYTTPFWEGNIVYNEIVHPIRNADGTLPLFSLMYSASDSSSNSLSFTSEMLTESVAGRISKIAEALSLPFENT